MFSSARLICALILAIAATTAVKASERALNDEEWRADIAQAATEIRKTHPRPFTNTASDEFSAMVDALLDDVPNLSDKEIILRLAEIVSTVGDGHTRLGIPRQHPEIGLKFGHTGTPAPNFDGLAFKQLPVAFEVFEDGIFVTASTVEFQSMIGRKLNSIDGVDAHAALDAVQRYTFAENSQLEKLMGADRLTMPEALRAAGIAKGDASLKLTLTTIEGKTEVHFVDALPAGAVSWVTAFSGETPPIRALHPNKKHWSKYLRQQGVVYARINEIGDGDIRLAEFAAAIVREAERRNAKLVIDLRHNFGGSGGLNKTLVMAMIQSDELNQYGRTFVLTGRRTFSAAQFLVNNLEQYTRTLIVGEPTGSSADHYGDSKKIRLENSGLTLRVSTLHWSSYIANDDREFTKPDLPAHWTSSAYFAGSDPALAAAVGYTGDSLEDVLRPAFERLDVVQLFRHLSNAHRSPDTFDNDFSKLLLEMGQEFSKNGKLNAADYAYQAGLYFYPDNAALQTALEKLDLPDE